MKVRYFALLALIVLSVALTATPIGAQDTTTNRILAPDTAVSGNLGSEALAQVYTLSAQAGDQITLTASAGDAAVGLLVTDVAGVTVAQDAGSGSVTFRAAAAGTYYVTVLPTNGVPESSLNFELTLTVSAAIAATPVPVVEASFQVPGELLTATGLQVKLGWSSGANLDLEVRDPVGGSLFFSTPTAASGGRFGTNTNSDCSRLVTDAPSEDASWSAGVIPTGSYEMLVYYQPISACSTSDSVPLTLSVTVDGTALPLFEGALLPNQVFIASFIVNADGTVVAGVSGVKVDPPTAVGITLSDAQAMALDETIQSSVMSSQPYRLFTFSAQPNQVVNLSMAAQNGSLDTLLLVLDANGNIVGSNDDAAQGNTDSTINNLRLIAGGAYTVVATRYGQALGGTQGDFTLTLSGTPITTTASAGSTVPEFPDLPNGSVEVSVQWGTAADLQLLVRDPAGEAVFDDRPQITSGGTLAANGNVNCQVSDGSPVSYIYWPEGRLPGAGPYEIEVQYQNACNDTRPVAFTLNVVANGQVILATTQTIRPTERFVASYNIGVDGTLTPGEGGIVGTVQRPDSSAIDYAVALESAAVLTSNQTVSGSIRLTRKFDVYVFDGTAGQKVSIGMEALNGTLDPVLFLLDTAGVQVAENDDAAGGGTTNSLISEFTLPADGRYIIIATHFGGRYGVTAGDYNLTLRLN